MKLTLLKKCGISLTQGENPQANLQWWGSSFMNIIPEDLSLSQKQDNADFLEKNLVWSKITDSSKITLGVFLVPRSSGEREGVEFLEVASTKDDDRNIWKKLRKTFGNKVKVSVDIKASANLESNGDERRTFICQKDLKIATGDMGYHCAGEAVRVNHFNLSETRFDITIMAEIPDDHELIRMAKPAITPLRTNRKILEDGLGSDVVLVAANGAEIKGHRSFLIASSPVFARMFANELEESKTGRVDMTDLSEVGINAFLRYLYCGDNIQPEAKLNLAFDLLYASHKYEVSALEEFMISYWMKIKDGKIDAHFAFKTYLFVRGIESASHLKAKMLRILHRKYDELKRLPEYDELHKTPRDTKELCEDLVKISRPRLKATKRKNGSESD